MGCICSKAITRTMSIREELSHGFQSTTSAWEDLLTSHSGNDQLFSFVCSANTTTTKLRTSSFTLPSRDADETGLDTMFLANAWDLTPDINGKAEVESATDAVGQPDFGRFTRSKSCQMMRDKEMLWLSPETDDRGNENKPDWKDKNLAGSRSFHTVEEYDALLERVHKLGTRSLESFEDYYSWENVKSQQINSSHENQNEKCIQGTSKDFLTRKASIKEDLNVEHKGSDSVINSDNFEKVVQVDSTRETGWKRKAVAKGLKSLDVSAIQFPAIARHKQKINVEGQVYSPGTYVTPKFGSYNAPATQENERHEKPVFSPQLVAAFEDCMQQLQAEEDDILRHMDGYSSVDEAEKMKHENRHYDQL